MISLETTASMVKMVTILLDVFLLCIDDDEGSSAKSIHDSAIEVVDINGM